MSNSSYLILLLVSLHIRNKYGKSSNSTKIEKFGSNVLSTSVEFSGCPATKTLRMCTMAELCSLAPVASEANDDIFKRIAPQSAHLILDRATSKPFFGDFLSFARLP